VGILNKPLPSVHVGTEKGVEAEMGIKMRTFAAPTLAFVDERLPKTDVKPEAVRVYPIVDRIQDYPTGGITHGLSLMTDWRPDAQTQKVLFPTRL
jgi:hypothetical protein